MNNPLSDLMTQDLVGFQSEIVSQLPATFSGDERKQAGAFVSNLLDMQKQRASADPFTLLRECVDVQQSMKKPDDRFQSYQNFTAGVAERQGIQTAGKSDDPLAHIKNKDLFMRAQQMKKDKESDWFTKLNGPRESLPSVKKPPIKTGISKEDEIKIGLEMVPMYRHAEMELTQKFDKIKGVREEINAFKEEHNIKLKYVQPAHTTHFMNRKISKPEPPVDYQQINKNRFSKFTSQS